MDLIAEMVLGYVDEQIAESLKPDLDVRILRYRDDYRILSQSDADAWAALAVISAAHREVGMKLSDQKTSLHANIITGAVKPDKWRAIELGDVGEGTIQQQLLRLQAFGEEFSNSGSLKKLLSQFHERIYEAGRVTEYPAVQVSIAAGYPARTTIGNLRPRGHPEKTAWKRVSGRRSSRTHGTQGRWTCIGGRTMPNWSRWWKGSGTSIAATSTDLGGVDQSLSVPFGIS